MVGGAEASSAQRQGQVPANRLELGTVGVSAVLKERPGVCLPEHRLGMLSMSTSITLLRPHSVCDSPFSS